jgi:hypothetical protein
MQLVGGHDNDRLTQVELTMLHSFGLFDDIDHRIDSLTTEAALELARRRSLRRRAG